MKKDDIKKMDPAFLRKEANKLKKELFDLKFTMAGGQIKDYSQFRKLRKGIARCLTCLSDKKSKSGK